MEESPAVWGVLSMPICVLVPICISAGKSSQRMRISGEFYGNPSGTDNTRLNDFQFILFCPRS